MYNELVYHLDLCTLAYQLHGQTFVWPMDPYYEQQARPTASRRNNFMQEVRSTLPGAARGLDPIFYKFNRILPWQPCIIQPENSWIMYNTPAYIHNKIRSVWLSSVKHPSKNPYKPDYVIENIHNRSAEDLTRTDDLYAFTGYTGIHLGGLQKQESLMGFVLVRQRIAPETGYDVHIVFRGSRSGSALRAVMEGLIKGEGNPDWVTDTDSFNISENVFISDHGKVSVGFMQSVALMLKGIYDTLTAINAGKGNVPPVNIYVAGHSLGAALATHFTSSVLVGNKYGANTPASNLVPLLRNWPWDKLKLFTYGAPTTGDQHYSNRLNGKVRISRVKIIADPITQNMINKHAGSEIAIIGPTGENLPDGTYHEPYLIRRELLTLLDAWKEPMDNIPGRMAPHVQQHVYHKINDPWTINEPWTVWEDLKSLHFAMASIWGTTLTIAHIFPSKYFLSDMYQYLEILKKTYAHKSSYKIRPTASRIDEHLNAMNLLIYIINRMQNAITYTGSIKTHDPSFPSIDNIYKAWKDVANIIDPPKKLKGSNPPSKNLGVCIILAAISAGSPDFMTQLEANYKDLYACINTEN